MKNKIKVKKQYEFSKVGVNEVVGLKDAMTTLMLPIQNALKDKMYWNDNVDLIETEYKSRDGFIAFSENCGGLEISEIIPECESTEFNFLEFGEHECEFNDCINNPPTIGEEHNWEQDGECDAKLRIWFKFEGINPDTNELEFYLYLGGGNGDAPYFRTNSEITVFEASFTSKSVEGLKRSAAKHFKKLLKIVK